MVWSVDHIRAVNSIVICHFKSHQKKIWAYSEKRNLLDWVEFTNKLDYKEKAEKVDIIDLPPSMLVNIRNEDKNDLFFIFKSTSNKLMYELSESYRIGIQYGPWEEKYKKLFMVYEELESKPDHILKSLRHSLSHARKSLNDKKTIETLIQLFGDKKINLKNRTHFNIFQKEYSKLYNATSELFVNRVLGHITEESKFEIYYIS
jgi:hypothetical protein